MLLKKLLMKTIRSRRLYNYLRRAYLLVMYAFEDDFRLLRYLTPMKGTIIDVGANGGQSVVGFNVFRPDLGVISFEPNPALIEELRFVNRWIKRRNFHIVNYALGSSDATLPLHIPTLNGLPLDARGSLGQYHIEDIAPGDKSNIGMETVEVEVRKFDDIWSEQFRDEQPPALIKIDVEGEEYDVVLGMRETVAMHKPILMIENSENIDKLVEFLAQFDYQACFYDSRIGSLSIWRHGMKALNIFFLPEKWLEFARKNNLMAQKDVDS
jgi:FkbM family methyltransferase